MLVRRHADGDDDGVAGGDAVFVLTRCPQSDCDCDGDTDLQDFMQFQLDFTGLL